MITRRRTAKIVGGGITQLRVLVHTLVDPTGGGIEFQVTSTSEEPDLGGTWVAGSWDTQPRNFHWWALCPVNNGGIVVSPGDVRLNVWVRDVAFQTVVHAGVIEVL